MFTSVVECILKPQKRERFDEVFREHILRNMKKALGFIALLAIASDARGERTLAVIVWRTKGDAIRYQETHSAELVRILKTLVVRGSVVRWAPGDSLAEIDARPLGLKASSDA